MRGEVLGQPSRPFPKATPTPDAGSVAQQVYPGIRITQNARDPNSWLGRANPRSWHNRTDVHPAIDAEPLPGMTFAQYLQGYRDKGYKIIEARDEVKHPSKHATGPHWHVVLGK